MYKINIYVEGRMTRKQAVQQAIRDLAKFENDSVPANVSFFRDEDFDANTAIMIVKCPNKNDD